ncbi:MAG: hypothetical protein HY080_15680 [Gammaproteobacteria bacterium]|nr:hypothetical protein [Gammaproteobacteria bacterium]
MHARLSGYFYLLIWGVVLSWSNTPAQLPEASGLSSKPAVAPPAGNVLLQFAIKNRLAFARSEIVTSGFPLADTLKVFNTDDLAVVNSEGSPVPSVLLPLTYWPAKSSNTPPSIKWLQINLDVSLAGSTHGIFYLMRSQHTKENLKNTPIATQTRNSIQVATEHFIYTVTQRGTLEVTEKSRPSSKPMAREYDLFNTQRQGAGNSKNVLLLNTPLLAVIRTEKTLFKQPRCDLSVIRHMYFYRSKDYVRVLHTLRNYAASDETNPAVDIRKTCEIKNLGVTWDLSLTEKTRQVMVGTESGGEKIEFKYPADTVKLYQDSSGNKAWKVPGGPYQFSGYKIFNNQDAVAGGRHAPGWIHLGDSNFGLTVATRYFWQNNPKKLQVDADGKLTVALWPEEFSIPHWIFGGYQKTHELLYLFHTAGTSVTVLANQNQAFQSPMFAQAKPAYYLSTGVFDTTAVENTTLFPDYERLIDAQIDPRQGDTPRSIFINNIDRLNVYGIDFFGDTDQETDEWTWTKRQMSNLEQDTTWGMLLAFLRKGNLDFLDTAIPMARHSYDIDVNHATGGQDYDQKYAGSNCKHGTYHIANGAELSHTWLQGILNYYYLTGDVLALGSAQKIADNAVYRIKSNRDAADDSARIPGWAIKLLLQYYQVNYDQKYLNAAILMKNKVLKLQHPSGYFNGTSDGINPWMHGVLVEALYDLWIITGKTDTKLKNAIIKMVTWLRDSTWNETFASFPRGWIPKSGRYDFSKSDATVNNLVMVDAMVIGYWMTQDQSFMDIATKAFTTGAHYPWGDYYIGFSDPKICAKQLRFGHRYLYQQELTSRTALKDPQNTP